MKTRKTRSFTQFTKPLHNCQPVVDRKNSARVKTAPATATHCNVGGQVALVEASIDVCEGLSWEKGKPLGCIGAAKWVWSTHEAKDRAVFKLLLNDQIRAQGEDTVVERGRGVKIVPRFYTGRQK